jgi:UPF0176 protein
MQSQVLLFYKYVHITDPLVLKASYTLLCQKYNLKGRTIIAEEGINGTLEGMKEDIENFLSEFLTDVRFSDMQIKSSFGKGDALKGNIFKLKSSISGMKIIKIL